MIDIENKLDKENYLIKVAGDVDASSSIHLDNAIAEAMKNEHKKILVDLAELNYISSAGLGVFMSYIQDFEKNEVKLVLFGLSERVRSTFQILGLDQLLRITDNKEQAELLLDEV